MYEYRISNDEYGESPDVWGDDEMFLVYDHRDFTVKREGFCPKDIYCSPEDYNDYFIFPVYAYIHSGVSLSLTHNGDNFDTSMRGYILISKKIKEDLAKEHASDLLENWNSYLSGEIYMYDIVLINKCDHCNYVTEEIVDVCGGFYRYKDCKDEAELTLKHYNNEIRK